MNITEASKIIEAILEDKGLNHNGRMGAIKDVLGKIEPDEKQTKIKLALCPKYEGE